MNSKLFLYIYSSLHWVTATFFTSGSELQATFVNWILPHQKLYKFPWLSPKLKQNLLVTVEQGHFFIGQLFANCPINMEEHSYTFEQILF